MKIHKLLGLILLVITVAFTAGCGKKEESKVTTQVAARVNAEEITVSQVNAALRRAPNLPPDVQDKARHEILGKLIDQQLAKQAAIEEKLDRTPEIVQTIEAARDEILARAYLQKFAAKQPKPSPASVKKYYDEHPELFAERRIYSLEELLVQPADGLAAKLQEVIAKAKSMQDVAAWLNSQNIKFAANQGVRAAEAIPLELLPKLQKMKDGEIKLFEVNNGLQIFRLAASKAAPVDEAMARPRIEQYLFNRHTTEVVTAEMKRLKDKADITLMGEFSESAETVAAKAKAKGEAAAKAEAEEKAKAQAQADAAARAEELARARRAAEAKAEAEAKSTPPKPVSLPQDSIERGISGIK